MGKKGQNILALFKALKEIQINKLRVKLKL